LLIPRIDMAISLMIFPPKYKTLQAEVSL